MKEYGSSKNGEGIENMQIIIIIDGLFDGK